MAGALILSVVPFECPFCHLRATFSHGLGCVHFLGVELEFHMTSPSSLTGSKHKKLNRMLI